MLYFQSVTHKMMVLCERLQGQDDDDESTKDDYLLSEEVQFANLEQSFREVGLWLYTNYRPH